MMHSRVDFATLDGMHLISEKEDAEQQADSACYPLISSDKTLGKPKKYSPSPTSCLDKIGLG